MRTQRAIIVAAMVLLVALVAVPSASAFYDVPALHEFAGPIDSLAQAGIVSGYNDGAFGLYDLVQRAQIAKMAVIAYGYHDLPINHLGRPTFTDVTNDSSIYPYDYVEEAAQAGLVNGYADGRFGPYDSLTRIQLVRIIVRAAGDDLADPPSGYSSGFSDVSSADEPFVAIAKYNNLVGGRSPTSFGPGGTATRGHVAKILYYALQLSDNPPPHSELPGIAAALRGEMSEQIWSTFVMDEYRVAGDWAVGGVSAPRTDPAAFAVRKIGGRWLVVIPPGTDVWEEAFRAEGVPEELIAWLFRWG